MSKTHRKTIARNVKIKAFIGAVMLILALVLFVNTLSKLSMMQTVIINGFFMMILFFFSGLLIAPFYRLWKGKHGARVPENTRKTVL